MEGDDVRYTEEHCWVRLEEDGHVAIGLTEYAPVFQYRLFRVDLPETGEEITRDEEFAEIETHHALFDVIAPVSGKILDVNEEVIENPAVLMDDPDEEGWLLYVRLARQSEWNDLLSFEQYSDLRDQVQKDADDEEDDLDEELYEDI